MYMDEPTRTSFFPPKQYFSMLCNISTLPKERRPYSLSSFKLGEGVWYWFQFCFTFICRHITRKFFFCFRCCIFLMQYVHGYISLCPDTYIHEENKELENSKYIVIVSNDLKLIEICGVSFALKSQVMIVFINIWNVLLGGSRITVYHSNYISIKLFSCYSLKRFQFQIR